MSVEDKLLEWASSNGIADNANSSLGALGHSLVIANFPGSGGRGLAASRDLKEGELILMVPEKALLNVKNAEEDKQFMEALNRYPQLNQCQVLVSLFLKEISKGVNSRWIDYFKTLPRSYQTLVHFQPFEIQALQVENAVLTAEKAVDKAYIEWANTLPFLRMLELKKHLLTLKAWLWACSTVSSRTLHVPWSSAGTLCPIGDLFNYAAPGDPILQTMADKSECYLSQLHSDTEKGHLASNHLQLGLHNFFNLDDSNYDNARGLHFTERLTDGGYDETTRAYHFYAREDYKKGDQVLLCYGLYTNLELLEHYGFVLPYNSNDKVPMKLHSFKWLAPDAVTALQSKLKLTDGNMHIEADGRPSFQLLAALRFCCAPAMLRKQKGHFALFGQQLSIENDIASYGKLKEECIRQISSLPTTLSADAALLHILSLCGSVDGLYGLLDILSDKILRCSDGFKLLSDSVCGWVDLSAKAQESMLNEIQRFLESESATRTNEASGNESTLKLLRWWLSITWRFCHKMILKRCISYCEHKIQCLI